MIHGCGRRGYGVVVGLVILAVGASCTSNLPAPEPPPLQQAIITSNNAITNTADDLRTGWYPDQSTLDPAIVGGPLFGRRFSTSLPLAPGEQVFAQPLVSGTTLFIASEANNIYALDAETGTIKAQRALGAPWKASDIGCGDLTPNIGITGTPVIDAATNVAYFFRKTYKPGTTGPAAGNAAWFAHAVNVDTLTEQAGFPVEIKGFANNDPTLAFYPYAQMQRPGLLLMNGVVYAAFGGHCDFDNYNGWVIGIGTDGVIKALFATEAGPQKAHGAGIWQSGGALVSDGAGRIFFSTGNGYSNALVAPIAGATPPATLDQSFVRLQVQNDGRLQSADFFTPYDVRFLDDGDLDFGSGGPVGLPSQYFGTAATPNLALIGGKEGILYMLNRDDLGGFKQGPNNGDKVVSTAQTGGLWSRPGVWPGDGGYVYVVPNQGRLQALKYGLRGDGMPALTLAGQTTDTFGYTSGSPIVTSDGVTSGSALVWITQTTGAYGQGQLRAYDAVPDSNGTLALRFEDSFGKHAKFSVPGVGAGRIYVATAEGTVIGYGAPKQTPASALPLDFGKVTVNQTATLTTTITANQDLAITAVAFSDAAFARAASAPALPIKLTAGQTVDVAITFAPAQVRTFAAALNLTTSAGPAAVSLKGVGQTANAQLTITPAAISFGGVGVGGSKSVGITLANTGSQTLSFTGLPAATAPFSMTGLPASGGTLAPGAQVTAQVSFAPTDTGTFSQDLVFASTGGNVTVFVSGTAAYSGALKIAPLSLDFGSVPVGTSKALTFSLTNQGGTALTLTKSKPPSLGSFVATTSLPEGTTIPAGATVVASITLSPPDTGVFDDQWIITANDGAGAQTVSFHGISGEGTGLTATYFDTIDLSGSPLTRLDSTVDFNWQNGSPDPAIQPDSFSARWEGQVQAPYDETYTFYTLSDDGIRLWVNGTLVIDNWTDHAPLENAGTVTLAKGQKASVKLEFYENGGGALAKLSWSSPSLPKQVIPAVWLFPKDAQPSTVGNGLAATYFDNDDFTGTKVERIEPTVDFAWGNGSPEPTIAADTFSARWMGKIQAPTDGTYTFYTQSDDGVRLWINGTQIINNWTDHPPTEDVGSIVLSAGQAVDIKMEFFEGYGGAVARLLWSSASVPRQIVPTANLFSSTVSTPPPPPPPPATGNGLTATYYDNADFSGTSVTRTDAVLDFDWGNGSPAADVGIDTFSARWTGTLTPQSSETYTFYTISDDGIRLWVNNQLVIDNFTDHAPTENQGTVALVAGQPVSLRVEYYEAWGGAVAKLLWSSASVPKQIIPTARLNP